jgi:hypothetical protein
MTSGQPPRRWPTGSPHEDPELIARFEALAHGIRRYPASSPRQKRAEDIYGQVEADVTSGNLIRGPCALCDVPPDQAVPYVPDFRDRTRVLWFCRPHRVWFARRLQQRQAAERLPVTSTGALPNSIHDELAPPCPRNCAGCGCALHAGLSVYHDERTGSDYDLPCAAKRIRATCGLLYVRSLGFRP